MAFAKQKTKPKDLRLIHFLRNLWILTAGSLPFGTTFYNPVTACEDLEVQIL